MPPCAGDTAGGVIEHASGHEVAMSDLEREREELADEEAGSTAPGQPWAKTSSGEADAATTDETGGIVGGQKDEPARD